MARAAEMPPGLTEEQRRQWVQQQMVAAARVPASARARADARLMQEAPEVQEPEVQDGVARWDVGHRGAPPHREGVALELPERAEAPGPGALARPRDMGPERAPAFYPPEPWEPLPEGSRVEVALGPTEVLGRSRAQGADAYRPENRPQGPAVRRGASGASRSTSGQADPYASVRALAPEVADYLGRPGASRPAPEAPQDAELLAEQGRASRAALGANLGRAGAMANEALTGTRVSGAWDGLDAQAQAPVQALLQRREDARVQGRDARERQRFGREEDLYRPDSERSRTARTAALLRFGAELSRVPEAEFNRMSAADVADFVKGLEHDRDGASAERRHGESMRAQAASRSQQSEELRWRMQESALARKDAAELKRQDMQARQDEKDLAELAKRSQPAAEMRADIETLKAAIESGEDIPGVGPLTNILPDLMLSAEGSANRQAAVRLVQNVVYAKSGKAVTESEAKRILKGYGAGAFDGESSFASGMGDLARDAGNTLQNIESGFRPEVRDLRSRYGGTTSRDIPAISSARPTGRYFTDAQGVTWDEMSDGSSRARGAR